MYRLDQAADVNAPGANLAPNLPQALPQQQPVAPPVDEIKKYEDARYVTSSEATWTAMGFQKYGMRPCVVRMPVHAEDEQHILILEGETKEETDALAEAALEAHSMTMLTAFFHCCEYEVLTIAERGGLGENGQPRYPAAKDLTYDEMPAYYIFDSKEKLWNRRRRPLYEPDVIGRLRQVPLTATSIETYYLRILLQIVRGPESFADLRQYQSSSHDTYKQACFARGLITDDSEWDAALQEASSTMGGAQLRQLFVVILTSCNPNSPLDLWLSHWEAMGEDFAWRRYHNNPGAFEHNGLPPRNALDYNSVLLDLERRLHSYPLPKCTDYGLPRPDEQQLAAGDGGGGGLGGGGGIPQELRAAKDFDAELEAAAATENYDQMHPEQQTAFTQIDTDVQAGNGGCFFLNAAGGGGTTFIAKL